MLVGLIFIVSISGSACARLPHLLVITTEKIQGKHSGKRRKSGRGAFKSNDELKRALNSLRENYDIIKDSEVIQCSSRNGSVGNNQCVKPFNDDTFKSGRAAIKLKLFQRAIQQ